MYFPKAPVILPSDLIGKQNGNLPSTLLKPIRPNYSERLHPKAATAWEWLRVLALLIPKLNFTTGKDGAYRTYNEQVTLFEKRYSPTYDPATTTTNNKTWNGIVWYLKKNATEASTPGNSNHGLGLAIDLKMSDGSGLTTRALNWLIANVEAYGFSWENNENWHIRYVAGDNLPIKVQQSIATGYPVSGAKFKPAENCWGDYPYISKPTLKLGSTHRSMIYLQTFLEVKFFKTTTLPTLASRVSTNYTTITANKVKQFQTYYKIVNDGGIGYTGIVGPATWAKIDDLAANY